MSTIWGTCLPVRGNVTLSLRYVWFMKSNIRIIFIVNHTLQITFVLIKNKPVLLWKVTAFTDIKKHWCMKDDAYYSLSQFLSLQACIHYTVSSQAGNSTSLSMGLAIFTAFKDKCNAQYQKSTMYFDKSPPFPSARNSTWLIYHSTNNY